MKNDKYKNSVLVPLIKENFKLEKHLQNLVENNLSELFQLELIESEFKRYHKTISPIGSYVLADMLSITILRLEI